MSGYPTPLVALIIFLVILFGWILVRHLRLKPSNDRSWVNDNKKTAKAEFDGDVVTIRNVRDFVWRSTRDFDEQWIDVKIRLDKVTKIWCVLEYFDPG